MKNMRDDPLWEELRYWLEHPITDKEQRVREKQEKAYQESVLNRIYGEDSKGNMTGGAAPIQTQNNWDKHGKIYQTDANGNKLPATSNYIEKIGNRAKSIGVNISDWVNESNSNHPSYKQKTDIALGAATLPYTADTIITKAIAPKLAPYLGRKIAQGVAQGVSSGAIGGAIEGSLRGYHEKQNPIKTILEDSAAGAITGAGLGIAGGHIQKAIRGYQLKNMQDSISAKNIAKEFYKDYLSGTSVRLPDSKNIQFSNAGLKKTLSNSADIRKSQSIPDLHKIIKNGKAEGGLYPNKDSAKFDKYHYIKNENYKINNKPYPNRVTIGENSNGNFFYNINDVNYPSALDNKNSIPLPSEQILGGIESNSIIPNNPPKLKSWTEWLEEVRRRRGH